MLPRVSAKSNKNYPTKASSILLHVRLDTSNRYHENHPCLQAPTDPAQLECIRQLMRARPTLNEELADLYQLLAAVTGGGQVHDHGPLDCARAANIVYLQESEFTFDELVADIAAVCACIFFPGSSADAASMYPEAAKVTACSGPRISECR